MSLATAKCSEPVSKITLTALDGVPMNNVPTNKLSGLCLSSILILVSPEDRSIAF